MAKLYSQREHVQFVTKSDYPRTPDRMLSNIMLADTEPTEVQQDHGHPASVHGDVEDSHEGMNMM